MGVTDRKQGIPTLAVVNADGSLVAQVCVLSGLWCWFMLYVYCRAQVFTVLGANVNFLGATPFCSGGGCAWLTCCGVWRTQKTEDASSIASTLK